MQNLANKKINNAGTCHLCYTKKITYSIENGNFIYYCHTCKKSIDKMDINNDPEPSMLKAVQTNNKAMIADLEQRANRGEIIRIM